MFKKNHDPSCLTEKLFRFCIVAEKKCMLSPARKKNIALLNMSSQCIVCKWKNVFLFHMIGKHFFSFLLMRKQYFYWRVLKTNLRAQ